MLIISGNFYLLKYRCIGNARTSPGKVINKKVVIQAIHHFRLKSKSYDLHFSKALMQITFIQRPVLYNCSCVHSGKTQEEKTHLERFARRPPTHVERLPNEAHGRQHQGENLTCSIFVPTFPMPGYITPLRIL